MKLKTGRAVFRWMAAAGLAVLLASCDTESTASTATPLATTPQYTVTYVTNAAGAEFTNQTVKQGEQVKPPTDPVRSGYTFVAWYKDAAGSNAFSFNTPITVNLTLYAGWKVAFTVRFEMDGGPAVAAQTVGSNEKAKSPGNPSRTGYNFGGWFSDAGKTSSFDFTGTPITSNTTIYAKWNIISYTVSFNTGTGGSAVASQTINHGAKITKPANPSKSTKHFVDWYKEASFQTVFDFAAETITADTSLYALWGDHLVTYHLDGGTQAGLGTGTTLTKGATNNSKLMFLWENQATKSGYIFAGWYNETGKTTYFYPNKSAITGDKAVWVKFVKVAIDGSAADIHKQLQFSFLNDDAANPTVAWPIAYRYRAGNFNYWSGIKGQIPAFTRTGYSLDMWYEKSESGTVSQPIKDNDNINGYPSGKTVYAIWRKNLVRVISKEFNLDAANTSAITMVYYNGNIYVQDAASTTKVFVYGTNGTRKNSLDFNSLGGISIAHVPEKNGFYFMGLYKIYFHNNDGTADTSKDIDISAFALFNRFLGGLIYKDNKLYLNAQSPTGDHFFLIDLKNNNAKKVSDTPLYSPSWLLDPSNKNNIYAYRESAKELTLNYFDDSSVNLSTFAYSLPNPSSIHYSTGGGGNYSGLLLIDDHFYILPLGARQVYVFKR